MNVYRPYLHPRQARRLPPPLFTTANTVGAASASMTASASAAGVVLGVANAAIAISAQAQEGDFQTFGSGTASFVASLQAIGVHVGSTAENPVALRASAQAQGRSTRAGEGNASVSMTMTIQALGIGIVPGQQPGAQQVDMQAFIERKIERTAEYRFSSGNHTRDFYQRGH